MTPRRENSRLRRDKGIDEVVAPLPPGAIPNFGVRFERDSGKQGSDRIGCLRTHIGSVGKLESARPIGPNTSKKKSASHCSTPPATAWCKRLGRVHASSGSCRQQRLDAPARKRGGGKVPHQPSAAIFASPLLPQHAPQSLNTLLASGNYRMRLGHPKILNFLEMIVFKKPVPV